jgi:GPH family glycoside/pentoside/hexuronide:cation symporter
MSGTTPELGTRRLPFSLKFGWGVGAIGAVTMMIVVNVMLLYFMVTVLGMDPAVAGLILGAVRLFDMFVDPAMGFLSDRTQSRWGRRRPWMLVGGIASGVATLLLFTVPEVESAVALAAWMALALTFYYVSYSMFYVPFIAMPAEMTDDYNERTSIMSFRTAFSGVAGLVGLGLAPFLLSVFGSTREGFARMAWVIAICIAASMLVSFLMTSGARRVESGSPVSVRDGFGTLANANFSALLATKMIALFGIAANAAVGLLFQVHYTMRGPEGLAIVGTCQHLATIASIPGFLWLARRFEKRTLLVASLLGYALVSVSWLASGPEEHDAVYVARGIAIGICYAGVVLLTLSMLPDVTADEQRRSGRQVGGAMAGLFSGIEKMAWALAPVASGAVLSLSGFTGGRTPALAQSAEALQGIAFAGAVLPALAYLLAIPFLYFYTLTRDTVAREIP